MTPNGAARTRSNELVRYDLYKDGDIDIVDIMLVVVHWGETCE